MGKKGSYNLKKLLERGGSYDDDRCKSKVQELRKCWKSNNFVKADQSSLYANNGNEILTHFGLEMEGIKQAFYAAKRHLDSGICKDQMPVMWTSPMMRTLQTARIIKFALEVWTGKDIKLMAVPELMEESTNMEGVTKKDLEINGDVRMELNLQDDLKNHAEWPLKPDHEMHATLRDFYEPFVKAVSGKNLRKDIEFTAIQPQYMANKSVGKELFRNGFN